MVGDKLMNKTTDLKSRFVDGTTGETTYFLETY